MTLKDKLLDKKLKAPLIPPKERLISEVEIQKMGKLAKKAITVLEVITFIEKLN